MRNELRGWLLGTSHRTTDVVTIKKGDEEKKIELRKPTVGERQQIFKAGGGTGKGDFSDLAAMQIEAIILCAQDPETHKRLFEPADREGLLEQESGGWTDALSTAALRLLNPARADVEKNSKAASEGSSSSSPQNSAEPSPS